MSDFINVYKLEKEQNDLNLNELYLISRKNGRITYFAQSINGWRSSRDSSNSRHSMIFQTKSDAEAALVQLKAVRIGKKYVHRYKIEKASKYFYQTWDVEYFDGHWWGTDETIRVKRSLKNLKDISKYGARVDDIDEALVKAKNEYKKDRENNIKRFDEQIQQIIDKKAKFISIEKILNSFDTTKYKKLETKNDKMVGLLYDTKS